MGVRLRNFGVSYNFILYADAEVDGGETCRISFDLAEGSMFDYGDLTDLDAVEVTSVLNGKVLPLLNPIMDEAVRKMCDLTLNLEV